MKEILLFVMAGCPHCDLALKYQEQLLTQHPQWRDIPLKMVDETAEPDFADGFDYYYVPTYYVGGEKVHEGHAEPSDVERVFRLAAGEEQTPGGGDMVEVKFYEEVDDRLLKFAVILAKTEGKWVFCKHRERETYEVPGGHREPGEDILDTAKRELYEETGALTYSLRPICVYSVTRPDQPDGDESFGMLYFADISAFEGELHSEIEKILITERPVENWTYPLIQPRLLEEARRRGYV